MAQLSEQEEDGSVQENVDESSGEVASAEEEPQELSLEEQVARERARYQPSKMESFMAMAKAIIIRSLVLYFILSFFRSPAQTPQKGVPGQAPSLRVPAANLFENGTKMDLYVYVSEKENLQEVGSEDTLIWEEKGLIYGDWEGGPNEDGTYMQHASIQASQRLQQNGSLFLHVYLMRVGEEDDLNGKKGNRWRRSDPFTVHRVKRLNRYKRRHFSRTHNLLTGESAASPEERQKAQELKGGVEVISHWHPNLTINIVVDHTAWINGSVPAPLDEYVEFLPNDKFYKPIVYMNDYWNLLREYQPINESTKVLNLSLTLQPISLFKWQLYTAQAMRQKWTSNILGEGVMDEDEDDQDSIKEAFLETSPYLLGLTVFVSILHSVFEFLAFKNDIQFWNNRKSLEGLSVRSVFFYVFQSLIVLLYVLDNETNTVVRVSCFIGLGIEIWKVPKVVDVKLDWQNKLVGFIPRVIMTDKGSYVESSTRTYDIMAFKYLSWALFPLLASYSGYSLLYLEHRGWYSFVLSLLYGFLLTFGFIMMTPQLFINYKLKSVAHLPWRMLTYKFLNTFIDDIFAFVIKMPTMYRLGCFRDDIVFFIYLYQRWIYKTDPSRVNEFGYSAEMETDAADKKVVESNGQVEPKAILDKKQD